MADTLTVALRVAEEAIEEAIAKAESYRDSLVRDSSLYNILLSINSSFFHPSKYPLIRKALMLTPIFSSEHTYEAPAYKYHFSLQISNAVDSSISQFDYYSYSLNILLQLHFSLSLWPLFLFYMTGETEWGSLFAWPQGRAHRGTCHNNCSESKFTVVYSHFN